MKRVLFIYFGLLCGLLQGQDVVGDWNGVLDVQGVPLRLVFHIEKKKGSYSSTMDSPDQGAYGLPVTITNIAVPKVQLEIAAMGIVYSGKLEKDNKIVGTFTQLGQAFPLILTNDSPVLKEKKRPQEPKMPYPYLSEEVTFINTNANIKFSGTLTLPKDSINTRHPVAILVSGSGPQNRNEEIYGHKPFLVLADYLTTNGIAVLRYDDRGTAKSTGNFSTASIPDFAKDVESAVRYLKNRKDIDPTRIGLIGHSEGGVVAPMVASEMPEIAFIVLLAGMGIPGDELLLLQQRTIGRAMGQSENKLNENETYHQNLFSLVKEFDHVPQLRSDLTNYLKHNAETIKPTGIDTNTFVQMQVDQFLSPWMIHFIRYDPSIVLQKVKCPVLALNGEKDLQVPPNENLSAIKIALEKGGNPDVTTVELPKLNHLFQTSDTGAPNEYARIEETFSPMALQEIAHWIKIRL